MAVRNDHSRSMTDLMAGLAAVFLLLAVIFILDAQQKSVALQDEVSRCDAKISDLSRFRSSIIAAIDRLKAVLRSDPQLASLVSIDEAALARDPFVLPVYFNQSRLAFGKGECTLPTALSAPLRAGTPALVRGICTTIDDVRRSADGNRVDVSITLEGHTDQKPYLPASAGCGVDYSPC